MFTRSSMILVLALIVSFQAKASYVGHVDCTVDGSEELQVSESHMKRPSDNESAADQDKDEQPGLAYEASRDGDDHLDAELGFLQKETEIAFADKQTRIALTVVSAKSQMTESDIHRVNYAKAFAGTAVVDVQTTSVETGKILKTEKNVAMACGGYEQYTSLYGQSEDEDETEAAADADVATQTQVSPK